MSSDPTEGDAAAAVPIAALPKGFRDLDAAAIAERRTVIGTIADVYRAHGFAFLETPALERADAIGAYLPDTDRGTGGVFAMRDADGAELALRYDMTAPLARFVAANRAELSLPFRRYTAGPVWRDEKPGAGRFREFWQCDVDTVGAPVGVPDAELCATLAAVFAQLDLPSSDYRIRLSSRGVLDGVMEIAGLSDTADQHLTVCRAVDKLDRLGVDGVRRLLGAGRQDESGDFTPGAGLAAEQIEQILAFVACGADDSTTTLQHLRAAVGASARGNTSVNEIEEILTVLAAFPCGAEVVHVDPSVVRGLAYYTGPVIEAELTFSVTDRKGRARAFGSVAGGGRYDQLIRRFGGNEIPATGISLGVDRLIAALAARAGPSASPAGPVVVLAMGDMQSHQRMAGELRGHGIAAEVFAGTGGLRKQLRYADRRHSPIVVIEGDDERAAGTVQVKDLFLGAQLAAGIASHAEWKEQPAQETVARDALISTVQKMLSRQVQLGT